eukprot:gene4830-10694_t
MTDIMTDVHQGGVRFVSSCVSPEAHRGHRAVYEVLDDFNA